MGCSCVEFIAAKSKWLKNKCKICNHSKEWHKTESLANATKVITLKSSDTVNVSANEGATST